MARAKIAPAIEAVIGWPPPYTKLGIVAAKVSIQADTELRALRAVVRAAEKVASHDEHIPATDMADMERALARLRRAGGAK